MAAAQAPGQSAQSDAQPSRSLKRKHASSKSASDASKPKKRRRHAELAALPAEPASDSEDNEAGKDDGDEDGGVTLPPLESNGDGPTDTSAPKKRKTRRSKKGKTTTAPETVTTTNADGTITTTTTSKSRFIAFIGNLPYDTTTASLSRHFASIKPDAIRHLTEKGNWNDADSKTARERNSGGEPSKEPKSKGFAFLEFENYDRLLTCLKLYHHSFFSVVEGKGSQRRINVELTAGGGGTGEGRKEKLKVKNERLAEERKRNYDKDKKARKEDETKRKKKAMEATGRNAVGVGESAGEKSGKEGAEEQTAVHPERMQMLESSGRGGHGGSGERGRGSRGRGRGGPSRGGRSDRGQSRGRGGRGGRGRW